MFKSSCVSFFRLCKNGFDGSLTQLTLVWNRFLRIHQYMGVVYTTIYHNKEKCPSLSVEIDLRNRFNPFLKYGFLIKIKSFCFCLF